MNISIPASPTVSADSGAVVMGTGIVSAGLFYDGRHGLSDALAVIAAVVWLALGVAVVIAVARDRRRMTMTARSPAALTWVAGSSVLGSRLVLQGWSGAGIVLLAVATLLWLALVFMVLRHWTVPTVGASFILTVSTESLAILAANLALHDHAAWLVDAALAPFLLGLAFYLFVLSRFDLRQLAVGNGDHWVSGGALAISTLAAAKLALAAAALGLFGEAGKPLQDGALALWALTMLWLPMLAYHEIRHPRLRYHVHRWATVFPVGMYAACSFVVAQTTGTSQLADFARLWVWVGLGLWLVVFVGMLGRGSRVARQALSAR